VGFVIKQNFKKLPSARSAPFPGASEGDCLHCLP